MSLLLPNNALLDAYLRLPWTLQLERDEADGVSILRVAELPSVLAAGETEAELDEFFWDALETTLIDYLADGEPIPLPPNTPRPEVAR